MSVTGGRIKAQVALKDLLQKWDRVTECWNDDVARQFHESTLEPLEGQVRSALTAMDKMREIMHRIKVECGDRRMMGG
jgi:hypothetical protein